MPLIAKDSGGGDFTPVPQGTHLAICNMVADLGDQETTWQGETSVKRQVFIRWELPHERLEWTDQDGNSHEGPMVIGKTYTMSLGEKANLRKDLEAWRGRAFTQQELDGFDLFNVLGVCCQVTVTHREKDGKTYANVASVAGWPKGMDRPTPENGTLKYSDDDTGDWEKLPEWLRKKIEGRVVAQGQRKSSPQDDGPPELDDEIPF